MSESTADEIEFDQQARRMAKIMGASIEAQIVNEEYRRSRGADNTYELALLHRAAQLRDEDAS
jgi:hypothetical protein